MRPDCTLFHEKRLSFEEGEARINLGYLRGRKMPPYTVVGPTQLDVALPPFPSLFPCLSSSLLSSLHCNQAAGSFSSRSISRMHGPKQLTHLSPTSERFQLGYTCWGGVCEENSA